MKHVSLLSRSAFTFALIAVLSVGSQFTAPVAFADCGPNAGGGNCKQATARPEAEPDVWDSLLPILRAILSVSWI